MVKLTVFISALIPFGFYALQAWLVIQGDSHELGADPGKELVKAMGEWTIRFLILTLSITPLRRISGWNRLISFRRMLGLFCFFYGTVHLLSYLTFLLQWRAGDLASDILERPYIVAGFTAYIGLLLLAATSAGKVMRLMGRNWARLHRLIYALAILGIVHLWWLTRADFTRPVTYGVLLVLLLGYRLAGYWSHRAQKMGC